MRDREPWERNLYIMFAAQLFSVMGFTVIFPFLPLYVEALGVRTVGSVNFWAGMVFSAHAFTMFLMAPLWGALSDRWGRKIMVERALFGGALVLSLMGFARSAEEVALLRGVQGLITGTITAANALVAAQAPRERAGWALGAMQSAVWGGAALGPLVGGVLADRYGFAAAFRLTGLLLLGTGLVVHFLVTEDRAALRRAVAAGGRSLFGAFRDSIRASGLAALYTVKFVVQLATSIMLPVAPLLVAALLPGSARVATSAGLFTAATAGASTLAALRFGRLGDRLGHRKVLLGGCLAAGAVYLLFLGVTTIERMLALSVLIGIANGAVIPSIGALLAGASPPGGEGSVYGLDASVNSGARMIAPLLGTAVAGWLSFQASFALAGLFFLLAALITVTRVPRTLVPRAADLAIKKTSGGYDGHPDPTVR